MKTALVIWVCAIISGVTCTKFVDSTLNNLAYQGLQDSNVAVQPDGIRRSTETKTN
jgi:hypothetical protein